ncbi:MAG: hypothetical protein V1903_10710 [Bacteroidota bacterium]
MTVRKTSVSMPKSFRTIIYLVLLVFIAAVTACAPAKQNPFEKKRSKASRVNTSQLGRNRFYFSTGYQKKLVRSYKKK